MTPLNAFVTPRYPVLFTPVEGPAPGVAPGETAVALALLVRGIPSFLGTPLIPREEMPGVEASLQAGDARVAVVGLDAGMSDGEDRCTVAFVSLLCADGRRLTLARIPAGDEDASPDEVARFVTRQIVRGVQVPDLVGRSG